MGRLINGRRGLGAIVVGGILLLIGSAASVAVLELTVRLLAPQTLDRDEGLFAADPGRSFRLTPGFRGAEVSHEFNVPAVINSRGLRDREIAPAKPLGVFRILVLGDSFTYGSGVRAEETYPKQLARLLEARGGGRRIEVINTGVSGYGTFHQAAFLRDEGWTYEPDLLILQMFPNNDLSENLHPFSREVRGGFLRMKGDSPREPAWVQSMKEWTRRRSHAYRFLGDRWNLLRIRLGWEPFYAASLGVYQTTLSADTVRGWEATAQYLGEIARAARERRVPLLVIHAPKNVALDPELQAAFVAFHRTEARGLDWDLPARRLAELCRAEGVAFLDLAPRFRETGRPFEFYYPHNGHWNARGHARVAAWILERLEAEGALASRARQAAPAAR